jgi:F0F1-type ATP synthase delta subunit
MNSVDVAHLAARYARAWSTTFSDQLSEDDLHHFSEAITYLEHHPDIYFMLQLLVIADSVKEQALHMLGELYALPQGYTQLCELLILHKRTFLLELILKKMVELEWEKKNIEWFTISSACPLSSDQQSQCRSFLATMCKKQIRCTYVLSPHLIAGVRMQSNHFLWEHSINKQIQMIRHLLVQ